jgi:endonuclease/exonuclease/phosphatase family metal-dependent hydrolase
MNHLKRSHLLPLAALIAIIFSTGCDDGLHPVASPVTDADLSTAAAPQASNAATPLRVMTRNMYLGGEIAIALEADPNNPLALIQAVNTVWDQVQATRFQERVVALVDEIEAGEPHVVGIQELPRYVILNSLGQPVSSQDHLEILMEEIDERDLPYDLATVQKHFDLVMPKALDFTTGQVTEYIWFTMHIAVLVRSGFPVTDLDQGNYQAKVPFLPGVDIERSWIRVTAELGGIPYHFVNTHLEVQGFAPIQVGQTQELLDEILAGLDGITVLMGDLNSDAEASPGARSWTPTYGMLMDAGFQDAWRTAHPGRPFRGYTCCQAPELDNPVSELGQRIDFVLLRAAQGPPGLHRLPGGVSAEIVGDKSWNRTSPSGLWPSDHAGLLVELRVPQGPMKK